MDYLHGHLAEAYHHQLQRERAQGVGAARPAAQPPLITVRGRLTETVLFTRDEEGWQLTFLYELAVADARRAPTFPYVQRVGDTPPSPKALRELARQGWAVEQHGVLCDPLADLDGRLCGTIATTQVWELVVRR